MKAYYGIAEIAEALGVPRGRVNTWRNRGQLPRPSAELKMGPVWTHADIAPWLASRGLALKQGEGGS